LNSFTISAIVSKRVVHFGITDDERKTGTKKGCRRANHYHMFCRGNIGGCKELMAHMEVLLEAIIVASPTDWDTVLTWPKVPPGTVVRSVPLLVALNATSDQGQALDANAASSSTFVPPLVASVASLPRMSPSDPLSVALDATSVHGPASDVFAASSSTFVAPPVASDTSLPPMSRSVLLSQAFNATLVHAQTSDVNAASSSTFVAPLVASLASLLLKSPSVPLSVALDATSVHGQASDVDAASSSSFVAPPVASVTSLPLILNATLVQAHASDVNAASSSTFVAPPVAVNESLVPGPVSAAGEDLKLGRSVFVGLVLRRCSYLAVTWQFTALQFI
jgi:hypothetical protein